MHEYYFAIDGQLYHISQLEQDPFGRYKARDGAQVGQINRPNEFGQMPEVTGKAASMLEEWKAEQGGSSPGTGGSQGDAGPERQADAESSADAESGADPKVGEYETKLDVPKKRSSGKP